MLARFQEFLPRKGQAQGIAPTNFSLNKRFFHLNFFIRKPFRNKKKPRTLTEKNKHLFPKEMQDFFEATKDKDILLPKRYFRAQKSMLAKKLKVLYVKQPELPLRLVIITILQELPDFLPADNLLSVTKNILTEWQKLHEQNLPK